MEKYYLHSAEGQKGPFTIGQLQAMWRAGEINLESQFWTKTGGEWKTMEAILDLLEPPNPVTPLSSPSPAAAPPASALSKPPARHANLPAAQTNPRRPVPTSEVKQGGAIGGWVCFGLGVLSMYLSVWSFFIYGPLFFVAFILAIVAMAQKRIGSGITLLLCSLVIPPILWFYLGLTRTAKTVENATKWMAEQGRPAARTPSPTPISTPISSAVRVPSSTAKAASPDNGQSSGIPAETVVSIKRILASDISGLDARSISMGLRVNLGTDAGSLHPCGFSQSGDLFAYFVLSDSTATLKVREVNSLAIRYSIRLQSTPEIVLWGPDDKSMFITGSGYNILRLDEGRLIKLPVQGDFGGSEFFWPSANEIVALDRNRVSTLNLDNLTTRSGTVDDDTRDQNLQRLRPKNIHSRCILTEEELLTFEKELLLKNRDGSYASSVIRGNNLHVVARPDLHVAFLMSGRPRDPEELIALYFGPSNPEKYRWKLALDHRQIKDKKLFAEYRAANATFTAKIYGKARNPLNGSVVGPDTSQLKGKVRIVSWRDGYVVVETEAKTRDFQVGDIAAEITTPQLNQFGNWSFSFTGLWLPLEDVDEAGEGALAKKDRDADEARVSALKKSQPVLFSALSGLKVFQGQTQKGTAFLLKPGMFSNDGVFTGIFETSDEKWRVAGKLTESQITFQKVEHLAGSGAAITYEFAGKWDARTGQVTGNHEAHMGFGNPKVTSGSPTFTMRPDGPPPPPALGQQSGAVTDVPQSSASPAPADTIKTFVQAYFDAEKNRDWDSVMKKFAPRVEIVTSKNGKTLGNIRMGNSELLKEKKEDVEQWPIQRQTIDSEIRIKAATPPYSTVSWRMTNRCENPRTRKWNQNQTDITLTVEVADDRYYIVRVETAILESSKGEMQTNGQQAFPGISTAPNNPTKKQSSEKSESKGTSLQKKTGAFDKL